MPYENGQGKRVCHSEFILKSMLYKNNGGADRGDKCYVIQSLEQKIVIKIKQAAGLTAQ